MAFRSVGINHPGDCSNLPRSLELPKDAGADFVELLLPDLGVILGGRLGESRMARVSRSLSEVDLSYTVHAPLEADLMDLGQQELQKEILPSSSASASLLLAASSIPSFRSTASILPTWRSKACE